MAEQTFKSPGFFEREIEVISRPLTRNTATPVGVIGPAKKGQAFVPKTITSIDEFIKEFGMPDQDTSAAHAISEYLSSGGKAATFCRILGTGSSNANGDVGYAGFKLPGEVIGAGNDINRVKGGVNFIVAQHTIDNAEHVTYGIFNDNDSITTDSDEDPSDTNLTGGGDKSIQLVRAMIFMHKDYNLRINSTANGVDHIDAENSAFDLKIHQGDTLIKSYKVSLNPDSSEYITKVLNTDSYSFESKGHYLYADFPVETSLATVGTGKVAIVRGKDTTHLAHYGNFSARFEAPKTTSFISQPYGRKEYDLFHFESLDDGAYASGDYKISIADLRASTEKNNKFGTFTVQLRKLDDTDESPVILESYSRCSLDPNASNYVARLIGDQKVSLSLDVDSEDEKRLVKEGSFSNKSSRIRIVMSQDVKRREVPDDALPFGFRGIPALRTTLDGKDGSASALTPLVVANSTGGDLSVDGTANKITSSILPPLPFRFKVTKGSFKNSSGNFFQTYLGQSKTGSSRTSLENVKSSFYWGLHTSKVSSIDKPNDAEHNSFNKLILSLTKYLSASSDVKFSGVDADKFNNNKFSLSKVAFAESAVGDISGTVFDAFLEAVYVRNADLDSDLYDPVNHTIDMLQSQDPFNDEDSSDGTKRTRATMAKLLAEDKVKFNKYSQMAKFTAPFYGGFDGVNILDRDDAFFTDRSSSTDVGGHARDGGYASGLAATDDADNSLVMQGVELNNNSVISYRNAIRVMTDEMIVDHNVLIVPGIRDSLVTDFAARRVKSYGKAIYLMDIPHVDASGTRIFVSSRGIASGVADVDLTSSKFDQREVDSSYVATYFPDVMIRDSGDDEEGRLTNQRIKRVPSSVAALGALAKSDAATSAPWFAPAGFSRGSLERVTSLDVRLNAADRDTLYEARINPIANFPNNQFVIFGQKTTQIARTALDRVNVRRLMINIKRRIQRIAQGLLFEQNDAATRNRFVASATDVLSNIRVRQGIEDFRIIMDETNNTSEDVDNNRLNGRIVVVPTRAVEFIAMDFIITNSGVEFPS
tara:strand:+ start:7069 stop:10203 length:3135 start_codon:yes stop_codon:yes gene_type:complete